MATLAIDIAAFRAQFSGQFPDPPLTDDNIQIFWDIAICYISDIDEGALQGDCRRKAINYVVAHLITLNDKAAAGQAPGFIQSASIDKISVSVQSFENKTQFAWWMNQTIFGQAAYAMLQAKGAGGGYAVSGSNELGAFRRAEGLFIPARRLP